MPDSITYNNFNNIISAGNSTAAEDPAIGQICTDDSGQLIMYDGNQWIYCGTSEFKTCEVFTLDIIATDDIYILSIEGNKITLVSKEYANSDVPIIGQHEILDYLKSRVEKNQLRWIEKFIFDKMT